MQLRFKRSDRKVTYPHEDIFRGATKPTLADPFERKMVYVSKATGKELKLSAFGEGLFAKQKTLPFQLIAQVEE